MTIIENIELHNLIATVEADHFRTDQDTGANSNTLLVWNRVRKYAGLPELTKEQLPAFCKVHNTFHKIKKDYGCKRE